MVLAQMNENKSTKQNITILVLSINCLTTLGKVAQIMTYSFLKVFYLFINNTQKHTDK